MTPTQAPPPAPPLLCREHSISTANSGEIDRFAAEIYATMEPALMQQHFINPEFRINLALHEAVINAWRHGNRKDPGKAVTVRWQINEHLVLEVMDQGAGFDFQSIPYVLQLNKRDLPGALPIDDLKKELQLKNEPTVEAVAITGSGIFETLKAVAQLVLAELKKG